MDDEYYEKIFSQASNYNGYLEERDYFYLLERARSTDDLGVKAQRALAQLIENDNHGSSTLRGVYRRDYETEKKYGSLKNPYYYH